MCNSTQTALVFLEDEFEEIEAIVPIDLLRRAAIQVTTVACGETLKVKGRSAITLYADTFLSDLDFQLFDCLVLPGGAAYKALCQNEDVLKWVRQHDSAKRLIGAICAAPVVLKCAEVLDNKKYTAHFSVDTFLPEIINDQAVVRDTHIITSQGAGTAHVFALTLIEALVGKEKATEIAQSICFNLQKKVCLLSNTL